MTDPAFSREIAKALDSYSVPPVPTGFADRLFARIASDDLGASAAASIPAPSRQQRRTGPWRRTSRIAGSIAALSLATATAAASGLFGDPVYVPVISNALIEAKIVDAPPVAAAPKIRKVADERISESATAAAPATGSAAIVNRVAELRQDPDFAKLTPRQKRAVAGREIRQMIRSGEAKREDVRTALRERTRHADPARKAAWREAAVDRRAKRLESREAIAAPVERLADEPGTDAGLDAPDSAPSSQARESFPAAETATLSPTKAEALRERYRSASPEQRAAMRNALRERQKIRQQRRAQ